MKKILYTVIALTIASTGFSQQELMVSQYMFNGLLLNPAYAGSHEYFSSSILHRSQWVQFEKAPVSQVFALDGPIANDRLGIGLSVTNDKIGIVSQLDIGANIAVKFPMPSGTLSFGLRGDIVSYSARLSDITVWDENDPVYSFNDISGELVTQFAFGAYYHTDNWFVGFAVPNLYNLDNSVIQEGSPAEKYFVPHYYLNGGLVIEPNFNLAIKPSLLVKIEPSAPVQVDLNCNFLLFKRLWLGAGYRTGDALIGMVEFNITPQLRAGYAYDFTTSDISNYSSGSHELMLGFDFGKDISIKKRSPRYF